MRKYSINTCCFVHAIKEHNKLKEYILEYIEQQEVKPFIEKSDYISNTDWDKSTDLSRLYVKKIKEVFHPYISRTVLELKARDYEVINAWYQQYEGQATHQWHYHPRSNWSAVYYVNMPNSAVKTLLFDIPNDTAVDYINLKEGDLFIFPANILHMSPVNNTNSTKTIVSFNFDVHETFIESI